MCIRYNRVVFYSNYIYNRDTRLMIIHRNCKILIMYDITRTCTIFCRQFIGRYFRLLCRRKLIDFYTLYYYDYFYVNIFLISTSRIDANQLNLYDNLIMHYNRRSVSQRKNERWKEKRLFILLFRKVCVCVCVKYFYRILSYWYAR